MSFFSLFQGGRMIAGWDDEPFRGQLVIRLRGNHRTPAWLLPNGPNQGSKVLGECQDSGSLTQNFIPLTSTDTKRLISFFLGVFGKLELYGQTHKVYHTKLAATADAGTKKLKLKKSVDWKVWNLTLC